MRGGETKYLNAKIVPSYKDNQVVGRASRKLDHKFVRVIIRLKPPGTQGRGDGGFTSSDILFGSGDLDIGPGPEPTRSGVPGAPPFRSD